MSIVCLGRGRLFQKVHQRLGVSQGDAKDCYYYYWGQSGHILMEGCLTVKYDLVAPVIDSVLTLRLKIQRL